MQKLIDTLYRHPKAAYKNYQRFGGILAYRRMMNAQQEMLQAASSLPPINSFDDGLPIYFLTGKKYLYQTLFCIVSLNRVTTQKFCFILVDDGSFDEQMIAQVAKQLPNASVIAKSQLDQQLAQVLPVHRYPVINKKRSVYPHLKKLTDVHALPGADWKLVLDSDMLFWQEPVELLRWLRQADGPIHMAEQVESYGYSTQLMKSLCCHDIPVQLNVGVIGLNSRTIDWDALEKWIAVLEETEGPSYFLEQALSAMLVAGQPATALNADKYLVNPTQLDNEATLHHYVDLSKKIYYQEAWKKIL